jgi:RNA polymerase sigma-70 factor (ECF subfamily)
MTQARKPGPGASPGELPALMARYCAGDAAAFEALYALVAGRLLGYLICLAGDRATAEDLLQVTFLKLHQARSAYIMGAEPLPWLYTIAHRTFLDEARRRRRQRVKLVREGAQPPEPQARLDGRPANADPPADGTGLGAAALSALDELPRNQREALVLTKVQGHSVAEAAAIVGTTSTAIKLRAHRAYAALRKRLVAAEDKS